MFSLLGTKRQFLSFSLSPFLPLGSNKQFKSVTIYTLHASKLRASPTGLARVDKARKARGWTKTQTLAWWSAANTSEATLRRFWHPHKHQIQRQAFIDICQAVGIDDWESIVDRTPFQASEETQNSLVEMQFIASEENPIQNRINWGEAPDLHSFYGRTAELQQLEQWIVEERCKLVSLLGMGGIGKTALAVALTEQIQEEFDRIIWRSLRNAPPLEEILIDLTAFLCDRTLADSTEEGVPSIPPLSELLLCLRERRCLVVLDNAEAILSDTDSLTGCYRPGYEGYGELLRRVGEERHQSCLVLTSREQLREIALLEGQRVRSFQLLGLSQKEGREIFAEIGSFCASSNEWCAIANHYAGNPLALKIVAAGIRDFLGSNIATFLELIRQNSFVFSSIHDLLQRQFDRLSHWEQEVMYWLAIARDPISFAELHSDLVCAESQQKLMAVLESLKGRSLIEFSTGFTQQSVVMEYVTERFINQICQEIREWENSNLNSLTQHPIFQSHAIIKATAKDYIRETQIRLILKPIAERLETKFIAPLFSNLREQSLSKPGYAAGNLLNLLCQLQVDLTGYDFSHLTIWQAYLRDVQLHQVNFANADLSKSVFAEVFSSILCSAFSSDGETIAIGNTAGTICQWQVADGKQLLAFQGHSGWCFSIAFSPDGQTLASGGLDRTLKLWDAKTGQVARTLESHAAAISMVTFSPDSQLLASAGTDKVIGLTDTQTGHCSIMLQGHNNIVRSVAFSPDGRMLASCSMDGNLKLWDVPTGQCLRTLVGHTAPVHAIAYSPDGQMLASAGDDRCVKLWQASTGQCLRTLEGHAAAVYTIAYSPDGQLLASAGDDRCVKLWQVSAGQCLRTLQGHQSRIWSVAFNPQGDKLASGSAERTLRLWDINTGQCLRTLQGYHNWIAPFAFSPKGDTLFSNCHDGRLRLWDVATGQCSKVLHFAIRAIHKSVLSPDGQTLSIVCFFDHEIRLFDVSSGECAKIIKGHTAWILVAVFSPNNAIVASGSGDQTVKLWDIKTGQCLKTLEGHTAPIQSIAFSPNGKIIASGSWDRTVKLWHVETGECLKTLEGHADQVGAIAFSPDSQIVASGSEDRTIRFWDVETGQQLKTLCSDAYIGYSSFAFSPDGQIFCNVGLDATIGLWCVNSGQRLQTLQGHSGLTYSVVFSPDGDILATGGRGGAIKFWDVKTGKCLNTLQMPRLYEGMNITGVKGLTEAQKTTVKALGAI